MTRLIYLIVAFLVASFSCIEAQIVTPVKWSVALDMTDDTHGAVVMTAKIDAGWHVYSNDVDPDVGPNPLQIDWDKLDGVKLDGRMKPSKTPHKEFDEMFGANLSWWTDEVTLRQNFVVTASKYAIEGAIRFSACNDENCIPPTRETFEFSGTAKIATETPEEVKADTVAEEPSAEEVVKEPVAQESTSEGIWAPVDFNSEENPEDPTTTSLWYIFITCFIGGFVALLTPCVWPMIPLTVSFFLKRVSRAQGLSVTPLSTVYRLS